MFDLSWSEVLVVGSVALVVIGPRELPRVLRTMGQTIAKVRRMAGEFQSQFSAAMREAELDEIRNAARDVHSATSQAFGDNVNTVLDPLRKARNELREAIDKTSKSASAATMLPVPANITTSVAPAEQQASASLAINSSSKAAATAPGGRALESLGRSRKGSKVIIAAPREVVKPLACPSAGKKRLYKITKFSPLPASYAARKAARRNLKEQMPTSPARDKSR